MSAIHPGTAFAPRRFAKNIRPGMTVLCDGTPSLVLVTTVESNGMIGLHFFDRNADDVIAMFARPFDPITIAPLAPTGRTT